MVVVIRAHLVCYAQVLLILRLLLLLLVHLDGGGTRALRLIHDLDLALPNLNRVRVAVLRLGRSHFFLARDRREPLARAARILLHVPLRHGHRITL